MGAGVGTDIVDIDRLERLLRTGGVRFLNRWFTDAERAHCDARAHPAVHYAGRFAAKEAVAKALGWQWTGPVPWRQIEIVATPTGAPAVLLAGELQALADAAGVTGIDVSVSHASRHATAVALAWRGRTG